MFGVVHCWIHEIPRGRQFNEYDQTKHLDKGENEMELKPLKTLIRKWAEEFGK